eukprot:1415625-Pyramimonas_sp.AAC.1
MATTAARPGGLRFAPPQVSVKHAQGRYRTVPVVNAAPEDAPQEPVTEKEEDVAALAAEFKSSREKEKVCNRCTSRPDGSHS